MRFGRDETFWLVVNPGPESEEADIMFEASLRSLDLQFKGGLTMDDNPALFTDRKEAEIEAMGRMMALRAARAIANAGIGAKLQDVRYIEILDGDGKLLFKTELPELGHQNR
ncbi:MAG: hypothetical protein KJ831_21740 [Candidatus Eisenbacteria bacterium]|nr:hypothetical protein [Candidatus Eisenbacteria bacterium]